jgi:hypothetical protein
MTDRSKLLALAEAIPNPRAWFFAYSEDAEWWTHGGSTYQQAVKKALAEKDGRPIYLQQARRMAPNIRQLFDGADLAERLSEDECWGEDGWTGDPGKYADLEAVLTEAMTKWFVALPSPLSGASLDMFGKLHIVPASAQAEALS